MYKRSVTLFAIFAILIVFSLAASSQEGPSRRDLYKFVWDFVVVGDGEATSEDLKAIASFYTRLPSESVAKIAETYSSEALSMRQKTEAVRNLCEGSRYGTVVTNGGETYTGVVRFFFGSSALDPLYVVLTKGGTMHIPARELIEIDHSGKEWLLRTNQNALINGKFLGVLLTNGKAFDFDIRVYTYGREPIKINSDDIRRVVLGGLKQIECPECFRVMEINWKYCPYDGTNLSNGEKNRTDLKK
ncbi:hypothetical protein ACFL6U_18580 [Planctomycetota bacterium]